MIKLYHIKSIAQQTDNCMSVWFTVNKVLMNCKMSLPICNSKLSNEFLVARVLFSLHFKEVTDLSIEAMICK